MKEDSLTVECTNCRTLLSVPTSAKSMTCPKCQYHLEINQPGEREGYKEVTKKAFVEKPEKSEKN